MSDVTEAAPCVLQGMPDMVRDGEPSHSSAAEEGKEGTDGWGSGIFSDRLVQNARDVSSSSQRPSFGLDHPEPEGNEKAAQGPLSPPSIPWSPSWRHIRCTTPTTER